MPPPPDINEAIGRSDSQAQALENAVVATLGGARGVITPVIGEHSQARALQAAVEALDGGAAITGQVLAALARGDSMVRALEDAIAAEAGGGGPSFGTYGPEMPTISGLTLAWDFDLGYEPLGVMRAEIPTRAGTSTAAVMIPFSGGLEIVAADGTRALQFVAASGMMARILNGFAPFNAANAAFTVVAVVDRASAGAEHTILDVHNAGTSGLASAAASLNRYRLRFSAANNAPWSRADGSNVSSASLGTPSTVARNIMVVRGALAADNLNRGMLNGAAKVSSAVRSVTIADWKAIMVGGMGIWNTTPQIVEHSEFLDGRVKRLACYAGAATDANMDTINAAMAAGYT